MRPIKGLDPNFNYYNNQDGEKIYLKDLQKLEKFFIIKENGQISNPEENGQISNLERLSRIWEKIKIFFGGVDSTQQEVREYRLIKLADYGIQKKWINEGFLQKSSFQGVFNQIKREDLPTT